MKYIKTKMVRKETVAGIVYLVVWILIAGALVTVAALSKTQKPYGTLNSLVSNQGTNVGTTTSFVDTQNNTWTFKLDENAYLEYTWKQGSNSALTIWDSNNGACGPNQANYVSMSTNASVSTRTQGITLAQTPMYVDPQGIQRTFRLQLYNADLRIESTNGDGRFWSIFGGNVFAPQGWPSSISEGGLPLWQSTYNFTYYGQFLQNGNLVVQLSNASTLVFGANTWANPIC